MIRYRFSGFTLSPQRRLLIRDGQEVPLIPRYFDLLLLLIERRREAVHRREIFDRVWTDAIVSESALSQAVRTIRRTLDDDPREPRFIRTVSRHGYQFVFADVIEEDEDVQEGEAARVATGELRIPEARPSVPATPEPLPPGIRGAAFLAGERWTGASVGAAMTGLTAGLAGGLILAAAPGSTAPIAIAPVLGVIGAICGGLGGAGVGAGVAAAEATPHSGRLITLAAAGALGGGFVGLVVQWLTRWALAALVGLDIPVGGGLEGILIGGAAGLGVASATRRTADGFAEPLAQRHLRAALIVAVSCGIAGLGLNLAGRPLVSGTINVMAHAAEGSRARLAPLGRLIGEPDFGPVSSAILAFSEGALFGFGVTGGLLRPRRQRR